MTTEVKLRLAVDGTAQAQASLSSIEAGIDRMNGSLAKVGHYGSALLMLPDALNSTMGAAVRAADAVTTLNTQLRLASGNAYEAKQAFNALFDIAQKSRVSFTELGTTYAAIARSGQELGISQSRLLTVTQSISQAMTIGGGSAQSMQAALVQLGQGLSSGTLRGEELNSIMEQTPRLAKAIADGLGVPIGQLRKLGETGQLTSEQVISALEKSAPQLAKEMSSATMTVGQAFTVLSNSATKFIGEADSASGSSATMAARMKDVATGLDTIGAAMANNREAVSTTIGALAGVATLGAVAAMTGAVIKLKDAFILLNLIMMKNPLVLAGTVIAAAGGALYAYSQEWGKSVEGMRAHLGGLNADLQLAQERARTGSTEVRAQAAIEIGAITEKRNALRQNLALAEASSTANAQYDAKELNRLNAMTAAKKVATKDDEALAALRNKLSKVPESYIKDMQEVIRLRQAGLIGDKEYNDMLAKQQEALLKATDGQKKKTEATEKARAATAWESESAKLYTSTLDALGKAQDDASAKAEGLSKAQTLLRDVQASPHWKEYSRQMQEQILVAASLAITEETRLAATNASAAAVKAATAEHDKYINSLQQSAKSVADQVQQLQDEEQAAGIAAAQNITLAQAIDVVVMARLEEARVKAVIANDTTAQKAIDDEIASRRELLGLLGNKAAREAGDKAAKKSADDVAKQWQHGWEETDRIARDAFTAWAENGTSMATSIGNALKKALLSAIYEATLRPIAMQIYTSLVGGVTGGATGAAGSALGAGFASYLGSASGISAITSAFSTGWSAAAYEASMGAAFVGPSIAGAGGATGVGATLSTAWAAIPGPLQIAAIVYAAYQLFHRDFISASSVGSAGVRYQNGVQTQVTNATNMPGAALALQTVQNIGTGYISLARQLGVNPGDTTFTYQSNTGREGQNPNFTLAAQRNGTDPIYQTVTDNPGLFGANEVALDQPHLQLEISRVFLSALMSSELPRSIQGVFDGLVPANMTQAQLDTALQTAQAFADLHTQLQFLPFDALKDMTYATARSLVEFSGGMQQLGTNLGTYYSAFYSAEEQRAQAVQNMTTGLDTAAAGNPLHDRVAALMAGAADTANQTPEQIKKLRDEWRNLVEASMLDTSESGTRLTAALLAASGGFNSLEPAAAAAAAAVDAYAATLKKAGDSLLSENVNLQAELMRAQGNTRGGDLFAMGITDPNATDQPTRDVIAQYDANQVIRGQIAAIQATKDFERAMLEASGNASGLAAFDKAANDAALIAAGWTQAQVDQLTAAQALTQATQELQAAATQAEKVSSDYNRAMLAAAGNTSGLAAFDQAIADAALLTAGWTQAMLDNRDATAAQTQAEKVTNDFTRAMLEASGDTSGLAKFDQAVKDAALLAAGWTQAQIDQVNATAAQTQATRDATAAAATFAANLSAAQTDAYAALLDANRNAYAQQQADANAAAQAQQQAAQAAEQAANTIRDAFAGAGQGIAEFVKSLRASIATPQDLAASYKTDLVLAQGGDLEASKRIPASGKAYLDSQIANAASMFEVNRATALMANQLSALPAVKTYEDKLLDAVNGVASAVGGTTGAVQSLHDKLMIEMTLDARSQIVKIIDIIATDTAMTPETRALALLVTGSVSRGITLGATSLISPEDQALALMADAAIVRTITLATANNDPLALGIALAQSDAINRIITVSGGLLNEDQSRLLDAISLYNKTVNIDVVVSSDSLTAFQQLLMTTFGTVDISKIGNTTGLGGLNLSQLVGGFALDRLNSIAAYIGTLKWDAAHTNASAWAVYDAARTYGVTQADIANATGYKLFDIQALFDNASIPRFDVGTNYLPRDMLAQVHEGERIVPKADNALLMQRLQSPQGNNEALVAEIRSLNEKMGRLNEEVRALRATSERGNANTQLAADRLSGRQGVPFLVQVAS